jgi:hypothetical protein
MRCGCGELGIRNETKAWRYIWSLPKATSRSSWPRRPRTAGWLASLRRRAFGPALGTREQRLIMVERKPEGLIQSVSMKRLYHWLREVS